MSSAQGLARSKSRCIPCWELWGRIHVQAHSGCWPNSVPYGCRTEISTSLLSAGAGLCYYRLPAFLLMLSMWPLLATANGIPLTIQSSYFPFAPSLSWRNFSACKGSCNQIGPIHKIQANLPILRFLTLIISAKSLLSFNIFKNSMDQSMDIFLEGGGPFCLL